MDVILLKNMDRLGDKHDVVTVKNGYGRNYLIPQGLAVIANRTNRAKLDDLKKKEEALTTPHNHHSSSTLLHRSPSTLE